MSSIARALRISPQKINENLNESGVFTRGYNVAAKTRKNSRWTELQGKPREEIDLRSKEAIYTIEKAYADLAAIGTSKARDLMGQYNREVRRILDSSPMAEKYKTELRAYNNFLETHHLTKALEANSLRLRGKAAVDKLEFWTSYFTELSGGRPPRLPLRNTEGNIEREASRIAAMELERARLNREAALRTRLPVVPTTPVAQNAGKRKTRKHRRA